MIKSVLVYFSILICHLTIQAQAVYVDSNTGDDKNPGTKEAPLYSISKASEIIRSKNNNTYIMKIAPGIYILDHPVFISTEKEMADNRIIIEACILPDDTSWTPEKMPVIFSTSKKGELPDQDYHFVAGFLIDESHVTIRGIKFPGYFYPNTRYFPIARFNKEKTDLFVEQCLFVGDEDASHLQVGIIAHGSKIRADHCVFYKVRNTIVFWENGKDGIKTGNGITNSIIYGATQSGIWTTYPDKDFLFKNNIVSNCKNFWIKNETNHTVYSIDNCVIVNNRNDLVVAGDELIPKGFKVVENNVIKEGEISLRQKDPVTHYALPKDYLHSVPGSLGYDLGAGLFKQ